MISLIMGLVVFLIPFGAVVCFSSRRRGVLIMFVATALFHLAVALISQSLGVFSYIVALTASTIYGLSAVILSVRYKKPALSKAKPHWFTIASFAIVLALLISLHYCYSGIVDTGLGTDTVTKSSYTYPLFSDEWVAVSLVNYSIESGNLPTVNPLEADKPFANLLVGFHALVAEIMLVLDLDPLTQYVWLAIANAVLICAMVYLVLRLQNLSVYSSSISAVAVAFITSSGNLPGIMYLLPYSLSITFLLSAVAGYLIKSRFAFLGSLFISLIVYPPMIVFALPMSVAVWAKGKKT